MCIFCDIASHKISSYTIYEDDTVMAFLDISSVTKGHTLVIPKSHCENFLECDEKIMIHVMKVAQELGKKLKDVLHAEGMNILSNIGEVAGQSVMHFHIHLIPRYSKNDACKIIFEESEKEDLQALCKMLND